MSATLSVPPSVAAEWPHGYGYCQCGCGQTTSAYDALLLRQQGLTYERIGEEIGKSAKHVGMLVRRPTRWVKGHAAPSRESFETRVCEGCGREFRVLKHLLHRYCYRAWCEGDGYGERAAYRLRSERERVSQQRRERRRVQRHWQSVQRRERRQIERLLERQRRQRVAQIRREWKVLRDLGIEPEPWWHTPANPAPVLSEDEQCELDRLIAEQERQARRAGYNTGERPKGSQSVWPGRYMDKVMDSRAEGLRVGTLHDYLPGGSSAQDEYLQVEFEDELRSVVGDLSLDGVGRLDDYTLDALRDQLRDAGLVRLPVQRKERERLKIIVPHRGYSPALTRQSMTPDQSRSAKQRSTSHKNRNKRFTPKHRRSSKDVDVWDAA